MSFKEVAIVSACRTAIGSFGGELKDISAVQLAVATVKELLVRTPIEPQLIDELIMGNVLQANIGQAPARQVSKGAGLPDSVTCTTINKVCASGLKSISLGAQSIALGEAEIVIAGGMESMSNTPFYLPTNRWGHKYGNVSIVDGLLRDALSDAYQENYPMGCAAELCAKEYQLSRQDQDNFAIESYKRSQQAIKERKIAPEIVPVSILSKEGMKLIDQDEEPFKTNFDKIPLLKPSFAKDGTVTAANSSSINDGAASVLLMSVDKAKQLGIRPLAIIRGYADAEQEPKHFTTTPSLAIKKIVKKTGISLAKINFFEINEAFSAVALANAKLLDIDLKRLNIYGGAVALGHPVGCSGARIIVTLLNILQQNQSTFGMAGICNGGGGASALLIERI